MVTTRYSSQQGSESQQNPCQVQPLEEIKNLSASRRCLFEYELELLLSGVLRAFKNLNYKLYTEKLSDVLPSTKVFKVTKKFSSYSIAELHEVKLCKTLEGMIPTNRNTKTVQQTSLLHNIASNPDRLGLLSPTHRQRSHQQHH